MFNRKLATLALVLGTTAVIGACSAENEPTDPAQGTDPAIENTDPAAEDPTKSYEEAPGTAPDSSVTDPVDPADPTSESMEEPMDDSATDPTAVPEDSTGVPAN